MKNPIITFITLFLLISQSCSKQKADIILRNGDIYTVEEDKPWAKALAIKGNKIFAVLDNDADVDKYIGPNTQVIDLKGRLALPGFIDAHVHFGGFSAQQHDIMLMGLCFNFIPLGKENKLFEYDLLDIGREIFAGLSYGFCIPMTVFLLPVVPWQEEYRHRDAKAIAQAR